MEFLDPEEAYKFKKQKWKQYCGTPCTIPDGWVRVELGNRNKLGLSCAILKVTYAVLIQ